MVVARMRMLFGGLVDGPPFHWRFESDCYSDIMMALLIFFGVRNELVDIF